MLRKILYDFIKERFQRSLYLYDPLGIYDYKFNKYIGFDGCYKIQQIIKDNIINKDHYIIKIDDCEFINVINIKTISNINLDIIDEDDLFSNKSEFNSLKDKELFITLYDYNWNTYSQWFNYDLIRYTLYIAYYHYLKELNSEHIFVQFVEFLSKLYLYDPGFERYITLEEYISSLKEINQKQINENLFIELNDARCKLESNKRYFHFYLD